MATSTASQRSAWSANATSSVTTDPTSHSTVVVLHVGMRSFALKLGSRQIRRPFVRLYADENTAARLNFPGPFASRDEYPLAVPEHMVQGRVFGTVSKHTVVGGRQRKREFRSYTSERPNDQKEVVTLVVLS